MATLVRIEPALFRPDEQGWFVMSDGRKYLRPLEPREPVRARSSFPCPMIRKDTIDPCMGMDGRMHDSLSSYRRSLKAENNPQGESYTEIGNEEAPTITHDFDRKQRRDDIKAAIMDVKYGRVPPPTATPDPSQTG